jgi:hypothetical protein
MYRLKVKMIISTPVLSLKERFGVQLNVEKVFMLTVRLQLEIMATDLPQNSPGTHSITPVVDTGPHPYSIVPPMAFS